MKFLLHILRIAFKNYSVSHMNIYAIKGFGISFYKKETFINQLEGIEYKLYIGKHDITFRKKTND